MNDKEREQLKSGIESKLVSILADFDKVLEKHCVSGFSVIEFAITEKVGIQEINSIPRLENLNIGLGSEIEGTFALDNLESSNTRVNLTPPTRIPECRFEIRDGKLIITCGNLS